MNESRTDHDGVSSFLTGHCLQTDDTQKNKENAEEDFGDEIALLKSKSNYNYEMMSNPKMMLNSPPKNMVQGTTLQGKKCTKIKNKGPNMRDIHPDSSISLMTLNMSYL